MSVKIMSLCFDARFGSPSRKSVAVALADHADDQGERIWPSVERLAAKTEYSPRMVQYQLRDLETLGIIKVVDEGGHGAKDTREWKFDIVLLRNLADGNCEVVEEKGAMVAPIEGAMVAPLPKIRVQWVQGRVQPTTDKGAMVAPEPSLNHQEPSARERACAREEGSRPLAQQNAATARTVIKPHTPQWTAWRQHFCQLSGKRTHPMDGRDQWLVPSEYPPVIKGDAA